MKKYTLTVRVQIEAVDDVEARDKANLFIQVGAPLVSLNEAQANLQEIFPNKQPRKINWNAPEKI